MLAVAQFVRRIFTPTETFIYNYLTTLRSVKPVCIAFRKVPVVSFPYNEPIVELYSWDILSRLKRKVYYYWKQDEDIYKFDLQKTYETLRDYDVKVLHAHFGYTGSQVLSIKHETNIPLITTFYGVDLSSFANEVKWQKKSKNLFDEGDLFFVEGQYMRERLIGLGCPPKKIMIQRIAIQLEKYPFRPREPKKNNETVRVLFCGRFQEKKGLLYAIEAIQRVEKQFPKIEFRIIGDGEQMREVKTKISQYQMQGYTQLLGFQSHETMIAEMDAADIFIHPSVMAVNGESEGGAPTTILEAQACGLPVLSTTHADIPNVVVPGNSALLAAERDVDTLCGNLLTLLNDQEKWIEMGTQGREFVTRHHNVSTEVNLLEKRYHTLSRMSV